MGESKPAGTGLAACVSALARDAQARHSVPRDVAELAARVTRTRLAELAGSPLGRTERARAAGYFWAVVRRRALRCARAGAYTSAIVRASLEEDLRQAGWDAPAIRRELERSFG